MFTAPVACPSCKSSEGRWFRKKGYFRLEHNRQPVPRYQCKSCNKLCSSNTFKPTHKQHRPDLNEMLHKLLCSGVTIRRSAKILGCSKTTVMRKMAYLAKRASEIHEVRLAITPKVEFVQFDEMETYEKTKLKPLTIAVAVRERDGFIIDAQVGMKNSSNPFSRKKYGPRKETRLDACAEVIKTVASCSTSDVYISSDGLRTYPVVVKKIIPNARFIAFKQEEAHKMKRDPLFWVNHTMAKLRADLSRLARKTWAATKCPKRLRQHLLLYIAYNNKYELR